MTIHDHAVASLDRWLVAHAGLHLGRLAGRRDLERVVGKGRTLEQFVIDVGTGKESASAIVEETRVGETYFFREPHQLDVLEEHVLVRARELDRTARIWSAGCSTGEEVYTVGMMAIGGGTRAEIVGSDISESAIEKARAGSYTAWSLRGPGKDRPLPWLEPNAGRLRVREAVRAAVSFRVQNLVADAPLTPQSGERWDAILCRNVLMYFDDDVRNEVFSKLVSVLAPGGWLLVGSFDPPSRRDDLDTIVLPEGIFYRRIDPAAPRSRGTRRREPSPVPRLRGRTPAPRRKPAPPVAPPPPVVIAPPKLAEPEPEDEALETCRRGLIAFEMGAFEPAKIALRKALYLDEELLVAELALGAIAEQERDPRAARLAYKHALGVASRVDGDVEIPLSSGATAADVAAHCTRRLDALAREDGSR